MNWAQSGAEAGTLALDSLRSQKLRSVLAIAGIVIGIITVVLVATILVGVRNGIAGLFRELGTENVFAFHRDGDPYSPCPTPTRSASPSSLDGGSHRRRRHRDPRRGAQIIVPAIVGGQPLVARRGTNESDTVLIEGATPNLFEIAGTEFRAGRPFTEVENRRAAKVAVLGANIARALFGAAPAIGKSFTLAGDTYFVVGEAAPRRGLFFGENRQDNVISIPAATATRRFPEAKDTVLYAQAKPGQLAAAKTEMEFLLRRLRGWRPRRRTTLTCRPPSRSSRSSTGSGPRSAWPRSRWPP